MAYIKLEDALKVCNEYEEWYTDMNDQYWGNVAYWMPLPEPPSQ